MIELVSSLDWKVLVLGSLSIGIIIGVSSTLMLTRKQVTTEKIVSLLVIMLWLSMHTIAFLTDLEVARMFDFLGFGATGHIIGVDIVSILKQFTGKK